MAYSQAQRARWHQLSRDQLFEIVRLRYAVFALEQRVEAEDFDDADRADGTEHWWTEAPDGVVVAYLRLTRPADDESHPVGLPPASWVLGRVAVHPQHRGRGLAQRLLTDVIGAHADSALVLHSQQYVTALYQRLGFEPFGDPYEEAGIPHVGMYRPPLGAS